MSAEINVPAALEEAPRYISNAHGMFIQKIILFKCRLEEITWVDVSGLHINHTTEMYFFKICKLSKDIDMPKYDLTAAIKHS